MSCLTGCVSPAHWSSPARSRSAQSHTPKHKTIMNSEADTDRQEPVTQAQAYTLLRNEMCLLSYSIMKQHRPKKPRSHSFPHRSPTPITLTLPDQPPRLFCQLLHYSFPSLLDHFSCSSVPLTSALCTHPLLTLSLLLSLFFLPCLIWAAFYSPSSAWKWIGERKKK